MGSRQGKSLDQLSGAVQLRTLFQRTQNEAGAKTMNLQCPRCGSGDIQSVTAVVAGGNWTGETVAGAIGVGSGGSIGIGLGSASHSGATDLARLLAPPSEPTPIPMGIYVVIGIVLFLAGAGVGAIAYSLNDSLLLSAWPVAPFVIGGFAVIAAGFKKQADHPAQVRLWEGRRSAWERLWYCHKCNAVSVPGGNWVFPERVSALLQQSG
jgi:hypothetical protein